MRTVLSIGGWFDVTCRSRAGQKRWRTAFANGVTTQGVNQILETCFRAGSQTTFNVGVIAQSGYSGVAAADTHASHAGWTEWQQYAGNRPAWVPGPSTGGIMNTPAPFSWTMTADGSIRGAFLASVATKGSVSPAGVLYCTAVMASPGLDVLAGDVIFGSYILAIRN